MKAPGVKGDHVPAEGAIVKPTDEAEAAKSTPPDATMNSTPTPDDGVRTKADIQRELDEAQAKLDAWKGKGPVPMELSNHVYLLKKAVQMAQK
jgi:hypothetical protein